MGMLTIKARRYFGEINLFRCTHLSPTVYKIYHEKLKVLTNLYPDEDSNKLMKAYQWTREEFAEILKAQGEYLLTLTDEGYGD